MKSKKKVIIIVLALLTGSVFYFKNNKISPAIKDQTEKKKQRVNPKEVIHPEIKRSEKQQLRKLIINSGLAEVEKIIHKIKSTSKFAPGIDTENVQGKISTGSFVTKKGRTVFLDPVNNRLVSLDTNGNPSEIYKATDSFVKGFTLSESGETIVYSNNKGNIELTIIDQDGNKKSQKIKSDLDRINYYLNTSEVLNINGKTYVEIASDYYLIEGEGLIKAPGKPSMDGELFIAANRSRTEVTSYDKDANIKSSFKLATKYDTLQNIHTDKNQNIYVEFDHILVAYLDDGSKVVTRQLVLEKYSPEGKKIKEIYLDREEDLEFEYDVYIDSAGIVFQHIFNTDTKSFEFKKINF
jgi:hypothetical protein